MAIQTDKLRKLASYIRDNDCQIFAMGDWLLHFDKKDKEAMELAEKVARQSPDGKLPEGFCGTAGCIAGHFVVMEYGVDAVKRHSGSYVYDKARHGLGLSKKASTILFIPSDKFDVELIKVSREKAAQACELMATHPDRSEDSVFWREFWEEGLGSAATCRIANWRR